MLYSDNGTQHGNCYSIFGLYRGYLGIMEKKTETVRVQGLGFVHMQQYSLAIRRQSEVMPRDFIMTGAVLAPSFWEPRPAPPQPRVQTGLPTGIRDYTHMIVCEERDPLYILVLYNPI